MPISKETFEKSQKSLSDRILDFLKQNNSQGFSVMELIIACEELAPHQRDGLFIYLQFSKAYESALSYLLENNLIKMGQLGGETYYGIEDKY